MNHYPITIEQREALDRDLVMINETLAEIVMLLSASRRDKTEPLERAEEAQAAVQRLIWAVERCKGGVPSGRSTMNAMGD